VAITPGVDFGEYRAQQHVRFSYANTLEKLREAVRRIEAYLRARGRPR
jgi:aspartate/methionine/tyrosine aminotransferase